jgi:hypothetical protein
MSGYENCLFIPTNFYYRVRFLLDGAAAFPPCPDQEIKRKCKNAIYNHTTPLSLKLHSIYPYLLLLLLALEDIEYLSEDAFKTIRTYAMVKSISRLRPSVG